MSIIRTALRKEFTVLPNAVLNDESLSMEALALLIFLLSKPPDWEVHTEYLKVRFKIGRDKTRRLLNELIEAGYIRRDIKRNSGGRMDGHDYIVHDNVQTVEPSPDSPAPEKPSPVNTAPTSKDLEANKDRKENKDSESSGLSTGDDGSRDLASKMVEVYHERCPSLTKVLEFTSARRRTALARYADLGAMMSNWEAYCDQIEASDFLAGRKTDFVAGWDFVTKKANYVKVMEGRYVNRGQNGKSQNAADAYRAALAGVPGRSD